METPDNDEHRASWPGELMKRRPILLALGFESALAVLALLLAVVFGLAPWRTIEFSAGALGLSAAATIPVVAVMLSLMRFRWAWVDVLRQIIEEHLLPMFKNAGPGAVFAVALVAGIGEELLFRGVIQAGLEELIGPLTALIAASMLFGLAHALTPAYFVLTSLMGFYLGGLYQATGNLLLPVMVHFLYDWIMLTWMLRGTRRSC